jgi:FkbM family methyltransferase
MYVETEDIGITPHLCFNGIWEPWITAAIAGAIKPGWQCIDIGANHGYYTLMIADAVGPTGRILAVEPNPRLAELLRWNVDVNGFPHYATVLEKAVSSESGSKVNFVVDKSRSINGSLCREATPSDRVFNVETVMLDELTSDWARVDFIKIDAEGAEESIWRGMQQTIRRNPDLLIIMEFNSLKYAKPQEFVRYISDAGFLLRYIDYDSTVKTVSESELVTNKTGADSMLFLQRK